MKSFKTLLIMILLLIPITTNAQNINNITTTALIIDSGSKEDPYPDILNPISNDNEDTSCTAFINKDGNKTPIAEFLDIIFNIIKIITPIVIIILTVLDLANNLINGTEKEIKEVLKKVFIRILIGTLIFLLPFILELVFNILGLYDIKTCI